MAAQSPWKSFFCPKLTRAYGIRLLAVALTAALVFGFVLIPFRIHGHSMAPTYRDGGFNFCNKLRYALAEPQPQDVVAIRLAGRSIVLLKRVVALEGDTVEFRMGRLYVNQRAVVEPYVRDPSAWNLPPRQVETGNVYVVGDNRRVPMERHLFGQTPLGRIIGGPLW